MPTYFHRYFGFSVGKASMVFGAITVVAGTLGTVLGGWISDYLLKRTKRAYFIVSCITLFLSVPFAIFAVMSASHKQAIAMFFAAETLVFMSSGPLNAAIVNATGLNMRSMAFAVNIFIIHALGDALSPALIGIISDGWGLKAAVIACLMVINLAGLFAAMAPRSKTVVTAI